MEDIKITSVIDFKTFFKIGLSTYFRTRTIALILVVFAVLQIIILTAPFNLVNELLVVGAVCGIYFIIFPLIIFFKAKTAMKNTAYLRENIIYCINGDMIAYQGDTISASSTWQYVNKLIERDRYFLLKVSLRSFHYFPKDGFKSQEDIEALKYLVREKGIKITRR